MLASVIIQYSQQTSEDTWTLRYKAVKLKVPGLKGEFLKIGLEHNPRVVDIHEIENA